eukprot:s702_g45.t1
MLVVIHGKDQETRREVSFNKQTNLSMQQHFFLEVIQMELVYLQVLSKQQQGILEHPLADILLQCHLNTWMQRHRTVQEVLVELDVEEQIQYLQQCFSGYPRVENVIRSQIAFYGIQAANGSELLRLLRREFSLMSRPEALYYREAALKYTVKKADKHLLLDVLREVGAEIKSFQAMLEASLI